MSATSATLSPSAPPSEAAQVLSDALSALGAPPAPPAALEWMYAFPAAGALLHALATSLPPESALTDAEQASLRDLPPPDEHVIEVAASALRATAAHDAHTTHANALRDRIRLLRAQRDALAPLMRARTPPPDVFADIDPGCDSDSAVVGRALGAADRARASRRKLPSIPEPALPVAPCVASALAAERRLLAAALGRAAAARTAASAAADRDAAAAASVAASFAPRLAAAASRRARPSDGEAAAARARRAVARALADRARARRAAAVDATAAAVAQVADLRVRLDALSRALTARRSLLITTEKAAATAAAAAPPPPVRPVRSPGASSAPHARIYADAHATVRALWAANSAIEPSQADEAGVDNALRVTAQNAAARARSARAIAAIAPPGCAVRALETVERGVARNAAALDRLLRERRDVAPPATARSRSTMSEARARADADAKYRAIFEFHVEAKPEEFADAMLVKSPTQVRADGGAAMRSAHAARSGE